MSDGTSPPPAALERARKVLGAMSESLLGRFGDFDDDDVNAIATALTEERTKALEEAIQAYPPLDGRKQYDTQWRLGYERLAYLWSTAIRAKAEGGEK